MNPPMQEATVTPLHNDGLEFEKIVQASTEALHDPAPKKRGRPSKNGQTSRPSQSLNALPPHHTPFDKKQAVMAFSGLFSVLGGMLSARLGSNVWKLTEEENKALSEQCAEVTALFVPSVNSKYLALGGLCASIGGVYYMKYEQHMELVRKQNTITGDAPVNVQTN